MKVTRPISPIFNPKIVTMERPLSDRKKGVNAGEEQS